ncbi:MAG: septum formation initiator family protein [Myxococcales bacterium]|nr:septum formation initiator family protein [Myxococcales bacterium]MDD9965979.1 septum formation initiator family protein [Myxococcales bacterium]
MHVGLAWLAPFALLTFSIIFVPLRILEDQGLPRYRALRAELHRVGEANERIRRQVHELQRTVADLQSDPGAVERIARDELGMLLKDEILFQFSE